MTTTQRVDVERLSELLDKATPGPWRWSENGNIVPTPYTNVEIAYVYTERDDDLAPANAELIIAMHEALPALLDQLAERDAEVAGANDRAKLLLEAKEHWRIRAVAAERARDEAMGLLREVINNPHADGDALLDSKIAAFLAANGGRDHA